MKKISICIATFNRCEYLYQTLNCIYGQINKEVEIIIVDGASSDGTESMVKIFTAKNDSIHYFKETVNSGVDKDFDKAVNYASGEYCWLFSDDDFIHPEAISYILKLLNFKYDLLILNSSVHTKDMRNIISDKVINEKFNLEFIKEADRFFEKFGNYMSFIGSIIVNRSYWLSRERDSYHGSEFAHLGVLFQSPPIEKIIFVAKPLIIIRYGNSQWANRGFEVWLRQWPDLVMKLNGVSSKSRENVSNKKFLGLIKFCILYRAMGIYNIIKYRENNFLRSTYIYKLIFWLIASIPTKGLNSMITIYFYIFKNNNSNINIYRLANSISSTKLSIWLAKRLGLA